MESGGPALRTRTREHHLQEYCAYLSAFQNEPFLSHPLKDPVVPLVILCFSSLNSLQILHAWNSGLAVYRTLVSIRDQRGFWEDDLMA